MRRLYAFCIALHRRAAPEYRRAAMVVAAVAGTLSRALESLGFCCLLGQRIAAQGGRQC